MQPDLFWRNFWFREFAPFGLWDAIFLLDLNKWDAKWTSKFKISDIYSFYTTVRLLSNYTITTSDIFKRMYNNSETGNTFWLASKPSEFLKLGIRPSSSEDSIRYRHLITFSMMDSELKKNRLVLTIKNCNYNTNDYPKCKESIQRGNTWYVPMGLYGPRRSFSHLFPTFASNFSTVIVTLLIAALLWAKKKWNWRVVFQLISGIN